RSGSTPMTMTTRLPRMITWLAPWLVLAALVATRGAVLAQPGAGSAPPAGHARKACTDAVNAHPAFAASMVQTADEQAALERDKATLAAHTDADQHVQKNERHVIYAYAAMWVIAAAFVLFLWRRQQALKLEIANLRRDLDAEADSTATKARS